MLRRIAADSNRRWARSDFELIALKQFHSDLIRPFSSKPGQPCKGDASTTKQAGLLLGAQTADCVPILLVDPKKRAVAAIHAGWRGTLARIAQKTVGRMELEFGCKPADLLAAIGPSIGPCCYEVGAELVTKFTAQFARRRRILRRSAYRRRTESSAMAEHEAARAPAAAEERPPGFVESESLAASVRRATRQEYFYQRTLHRLPHRSLFQLPQRRRIVWPHAFCDWGSREVRTGEPPQYQDCEALFFRPKSSCSTISEIMWPIRVWHS